MAVSGYRPLQLEPSCLAEREVLAQRDPAEPPRWPWRQHACSDLAVLRHPASWSPGSDPSDAVVYILLLVVFEYALEVQLSISIGTV